MWGTKTRLFFQALLVPLTNCISFRDFFFLEFQIHTQIDHDLSPLTNKHMIQIKGILVAHKIPLKATCYIRNQTMDTLQEHDFIVIVF